MELPDNLWTTSRPMKPHRAVIRLIGNLRFPNDEIFSPIPERFEPIDDNTVQVQANKSLTHKITESSIKSSETTIATRIMNTERTLQIRKIIRQVMASNIASNPIRIICKTVKLER